MQKYITSVVTKIRESNTDFAKTTIIIPSKRAGIHIKEAFKKNSNHYSFIPKILSIEEFIQEISKKQVIDTITLLFDFYKIYLENTPKNKIENFDTVSNWATTLIQDFNEIDSNLIDATYVFNYINDINRINNWFTKDNKETKLSNNYISFFNFVAIYYKKLYSYLIANNKGYQGLLYREACKNIDGYIKNNTDAKLIFIGFNALNKAEEFIFKKLLDNKIATLSFDLDEFFIKEKIAASNFINQYKTTWNYYKNNNFNTIDSSFTETKSIQVIGLSKNVTQVKYIGELLKQTLSNKNSQKEIALVLANENLLPITLSSLPKEVKNVNITMGYPLKNMVLSNLFSLIFKLHLNRNKIGKNNTFYYKDINAILQHKNITNLYPTINLITESILNENLLFIEKIKILELAKNNLEVSNLIRLIFSKWDITNFSNNSLKLLRKLKKKQQNNVELIYINKFETIFVDLQSLNENYNFIKSIDTLYEIYKQLLNYETIAFKGQALEGLQIMGMLETRLLDFDTIIISSVNEGFLPAGKATNSFIPFDVKREVGLPTYQEKDAIFSYHFYRLIARAKNIFILYNTETDNFGSGEQSRFITQLEYLQKKLPKHTFTRTIISPKVNSIKKRVQTIPKTKMIQQRLLELASKGISPTTLTNYIYNPIAFYKQKILNIKNLNEIEETIASNTLGTVIHKSLESFYIPFKGKFIKITDLKEMKKEIPKKIISLFKKEFLNGDLKKGKNLLIFEVAKQFVTNFINQEINLLKNGDKLKIIALEVDLETQLKIVGFDHSFKLKGQADRIDELDGIIRIIDYKTGLVKQTDLNIKNWNEISKEHKYNKAFQVLLYAYMFSKMNKISLDHTKIESGIISFKNLKSGFLKVNKSNITTNDLVNFENELINLIKEIYTKDIPFIENENLPY